MRLRVFLVIVLLVFLGFGCSSLTRFSSKTAKGVMEFTQESGGVIHQYLVAWPTYSGAIDGLPQMYKDWLPKAFWDAKKITDELSACCKSLKVALGPNPPEVLCDFSNWNPSVPIPPAVYYQARKVAEQIIIKAELGPILPFPEGDKKDEYTTGYALAIAATMANEVILKALKDLSYIPEIAKLLKVIPALVL